MADITVKLSEYATPTAHISAINRADIIKTSVEVEKPTGPDYSGDEWDPF